MSEEQKTLNEDGKTVWGQPRVPNIKKGHNPNYPFYMMGVFLVLAALSVLFAFLTD